MTSLAQLAPTIFCIVAGVVLGAVVAAYPLVVAHDPLGEHIQALERGAMLGGVYGAIVGVVANVVLLRRNARR